MLVEDLHNINFYNEKDNQDLEYLINALRDWRIYKDTVEEYILEIKDFLGGRLDLTKRDINKYLIISKYFG